MRKHHVAILAAIVFAIAGFASAQQAYFNPEIGNGKWSAAQPPVSPAYTQAGYFNPEIGNVPPDQAIAMTREHDGRTGKLDIIKGVKLGETVLKPGAYMVRHVDTRASRTSWNFRKWWRTTTVAETRLSPKSAGTTAQLGIRGEKAVHLF